MITKNLKFIFVGAALALSTLIAGDGNDTLSSDDITAPPPSRNSPTLPNDSDLAFDSLISKLRTLSMIKKRIVSWKNAIADFQTSPTDNPALQSLDQIKERILAAGLGEKRNKIVERAIAGLKFDSEHAATAPLAIIPPSAQKYPVPMPIGLILMSNVPLKQRPIFSSERKGTRFAVLAEDSNTPKTPVGTKVLSPDAIAENLKTHIAAQDDAIDLLSMLAHRFLCNKAAIERGEMVSCTSLHCILTGPTGCGKSETLKKLTELLGAPILYINARSLTDEGFKGQNFSECVEKFYKENKDVRSVIVALEELDKLGARTQIEEDTKSFGRAIQRVLLTPLDGNPISIKDKPAIPTANWWFIGTGAFSEQKGIHDAKGDRTTTVRTSQDIVNVGFEPEFVGRFPSVIAFKGHTLQTMVDVITRKSSPIYRVKDEFKRNYGINLVFKGEAIHALASASIEMNLGVRSLNSILNSALRPSFGRALGIMNLRGEELSLTISLEDIQPAIDQFKRDNKKRDPDDDMSDSLKLFYGRI